MAQQASISIRVEKDLKQRFYKLCEDFGLSATSAFNIFMKAVVREHKIPFEISSIPEEEKIKSAKDNFDSMRKQLYESGAKELTLNEINEIIKEVRDEQRNKQNSGGH